MSKLSRKIITAAIMVSMAVTPYISNAFTVSTDSGSGQTPYSNTSGGVTNTGSTGNNSGNISTSDPSYKGLPGTGGTTNTSSGVGSGGSATGKVNTSTGVASSGSGNSNTSTGVGVGTASSGSSTGGGVSTSDPSYKGLPGSNGSTSGSGNSSTGVSTDDDDYKGLPGSGGNTDNTSTGVSTDDDDYKGLPDTNDNDHDHNRVESKCKGHYYPSDIDDHWAEIYIRRLYDLCIVEGYGNGTFRPNNNITRAELVKMALYSKGIKPNPGCYDADCGSPFMDLDMWQGKWIRPAWDRNVIQGYSYNRFAPNRQITRAEAVKVILATYGYSPLSTSDSFFNDVSGWSVGWIEQAHELGIVNGVGHGNFEPDRKVTRAEAAKMIALTMEYWDTHIK